MPRKYRTTQRWFSVEIDVPTGNNHILLAVSSGPGLSTAVNNVCGNYT